MGIKLRVLSGQIPGRKGIKPECIGELGTHPTCRAGSRGPEGPGLKVGVGWVGLSKPPANTAISFPGQQEARALVGFSAKAFPLSGEQLLYTELPLPLTPPCFPQLRQTTQQGSFVWGHFGLGTQGEGLTEEPLAFGHFGCPIWNTL